MFQRTVLLSYSGPSCPRSVAVKALQFCETLVTICSRESLQSLAYFFAYLTKALFELSKSYSVELCVHWYKISIIMYYFHGAV